MLQVKPSSTTNGNSLINRASVTSAGQQLILPKATAGYLSNNTNHLGAGGYTSSRGNGALNSSGAANSMLTNQQKLPSKTNLHHQMQNAKQMHIIIEDKENRRDIVNRQTAVAA